MATSNDAQAIASEIPSAMRIGYETRIGRKRWAGRVVATPDTIYCLLVMANSMSDLMVVGVGGGLFGAVGGLVAGALSKSMATAPPAITKVGDLPEFLHATRTSPFGRAQKSIPVLVIPKTSIKLIEKRGLINNTLQMDVQGEKVVLSHIMFGGGKVRDYLIAAGWPIAWRGQRANVEQAGV